MEQFFLSWQQGGEFFMIFQNPSAAGNVIQQIKILMACSHTANAIAKAILQLRLRLLAKLQCE